MGMIEARGGVEAAVASIGMLCAWNRISRIRTRSYKEQVISEIEWKSIFLMTEKG